MIFWYQKFSMKANNKVFNNLIKFKVNLINWKIFHSTLHHDALRQTLFKVFLRWIKFSREKNVSLIKGERNKSGFLKCFNTYRQEQSEISTVRFVFQSNFFPNTPTFHNLVHLSAYKSIRSLLPLSNLRKVAEEKKNLVDLSEIHSIYIEREKKC